MRRTAIFHALAGTNKIIVEDVRHDKAKEKSEIIARPPKGEECRCGICRRKSIRYDRGKGPRRASSE